jgi:hypothetical protein
VSGDPLGGLDQKTRREFRRLGEEAISTVEFNDLLHQETERLGKFVEKLDHELRPMLVVFGEKGKDDKRMAGVVQIASFPEGDAKRRVLFAAGAQAAKEGIQIIAALLCTEAWAKTLSPAESWRAKSQGLMQPSKAPDRREVVFITGRTIDGRTASAYAPFTRIGGRTKAEPWRFMEWRGENADAEAQENLVGYFFAGYMLELCRRNAR